MMSELEPGNLAAVEQIDAAMREAESHDSSAKYPALDYVPDRRLMSNAVLGLHRAARTGLLPGEPSNKWTAWPDKLSQSTDTREWSEGQGGVWLPEFNENDPDHAGKMFGVFASAPGELHVLLGGYTVDRWLGREPITEARCDWLRYARRYHWRDHQGILQRCQDKRADEYLLFSQGQYLVAVATCAPCRDWLLAGGSMDKP